MLELVLLDGSERRFGVDEGAELTIGAATQCDIRLTTADVSRKHALLTCRGGTLLLLDLGSTNGTFVNGRRIKEATLSPGDAIRFSSVVAQLVPAGSSSADGTVAAQIPSPLDRRATSDRMPVILQESLISLLSRWGVGDGNGISALTEWLVTQRGMLGAAVLELDHGEIVVRAASGDVGGRLENGRLRELLAAPPPEPGTIGSVQLGAPDGRLLALRAAGAPMLVLYPGASTPDAVELQMVTRLLSVAHLLDGRGRPAGRRRA